ncbi:MAG TPA: hypothetical protein VGO31_11765 [Microbacteriaceae bacterium]|nr:hypothetical protein [Microbacteriaceae bacterium]
MTGTAIHLHRTLSGRRYRPRNRFPWLPLVVLAVVVVLFAAMTAEIGLRIGDLRSSNLAALRCVGAGTVLQGQKGLYELDPAAGYVMQPETCVRLRSTEYDGILRTNRTGLVGPEIGASKPAGEFRIVILGDSYAVGGQVPYEQTFPAVLEARLHGAGLTQVRVIDAAVGGYTTFNEAGLLRERLAEWQPDLVIVAAFLGNDVSENVLATAAGYRLAPEHPKGMTWGASAPRLVDESGTWFPRNGLAPDGGSVPPPWNAQEPLPAAVGNQTASATPPAPNRPPPSPVQRVRAGMRLTWDALRANSLLLGGLFGVPIDPGVTTAPGSLPPAAEMSKLNLTSFEWTILREVPHTYWLDVAWPLFGRYLAAIRETAAPVRVVVMAIPEMSQFDDQMHARRMQDFRFQPDEVDWDRPQRELAAEVQRADLAELDLLPLFRARADRAELYLRFDTHFTAHGHDVTAEALASFLTVGGWLP